MNYREAISKYWDKHYIGDDGSCALCGNYGLLTDRHGKQRPCVCPNGQIKAVGEPKQ